MALTQVEKHLIAGLKLHSVPRGTVVAILLHLKTEDQQLELAQYMMENEQAAPEELLRVAQRLAEQR